MRLLVGGGTGFIGKVVVKTLSKSHNVTIISRNSGHDSHLTWKEINEKGLPPCDAIIQLTGANITEKTWTPERKKELIDSRIGVTESIVKAISEAKEPPKTFICASAIGYYPIEPRGEIFDDYYNGPPAKNFAGELVSNWEKAVLKAPENVRKVMTRFGIVLGNNGGALSQMLLPFKLGLGGPMGSGKQYWPWIHIQDVAESIQFALENPNVSGPVNVVAPQSCTNAEFSSALASALHRPAFFTVPEIALRFIFGERYYLLTEGNQVIPKKLQEFNYQFKYPTLQDAFQEILYAK